MIANFLLNYFGQARGIKLNSHDKLTKNYEKYGVVKGLDLPKQFGESLLFLKESVCDYRDKQISHLQNPRTVKATLFSMQGQTGIAATQIYPNAHDTQVESTELSTIMDRIDQYIQQVLEVVRLNRAKTRFSLMGK